MHFFSHESSKGIKILAVAMAGGLMLTGAQAKKPNPEKLAERDKMLADEDQKAFEANMALYEKDVKPFFDQHCISCHGPKKAKGFDNSHSLFALVKETK